MLENSVYSVISPEGCASILWKDPSKTAYAAECLRVTAQDLFKLGVVERVIREPKSVESKMFDSLKSIIASTFDRYNRFRALGNNVNPLEPVAEEEPQQS